MQDQKKEFLDKAKPLAQRLIGYAMTEGKKYGITDVAVYVLANDNENYSVEKGEVTSAKAGESFRVHVYLYAGKRELSFAKNTVDGEVLSTAMLDNMKAIHLVPENPYTGLLEKEKVFKGRAEDLAQFDPATPSSETMIDYAKKAETAAMSVEGVKGVRSVSASRGLSHYFVLATNGFEKYESKTHCSASASVIAEDKNGMEIDGDYNAAVRFADLLTPEDLGRTAAKNAVGKLGASLPATGEMPVVLDNDSATTFFSSVFSAIGGTKVFQGTSFLKDKVGAQVMNAGITITDDPRIAGEYSSQTVDGSGMEAKKITFIDKGVLKSYMISLTEARQLGIEPIGRSNGFVNVIVEPGTKTPAALIADIKEGILIKGFNGGTADVNTGDFSREAYGVMIENGQVTKKAVAGFVVAGNLKDMFMKAAVANDTPKLPHPRHGSFAAPTTRLDGMTVAGK